MTNPTPMYSLRTEGNGHRITKFVDGEVEASYSVSESECECPAGHRHTCRHRQMLPTMLAHGIADTHWFYLHDRGGAIVDFNGTSKHLLDQLATEPSPTMIAAKSVLDRLSEPNTAGAPELKNDLHALRYQGREEKLSAGAAQHAELVLEDDELVSEAEAWSTILGERVSAVHHNVPIIEVASVADLTQIAPDTEPDILADLPPGHSARSGHVIGRMSAKPWRRL